MVDVTVRWQEICIKAKVFEQDNLVNSLRERRNLIRVTQVRAIFIPHLVQNKQKYVSFDISRV